MDSRSGQVLLPVVSLQQQSLLFVERRAAQEEACFLNPAVVCRGFAREVSGLVWLQGCWQSRRSSRSACGLASRCLLPSAALRTEESVLLAPSCLNQGKFLIYNQNCISLFFFFLLKEKDASLTGLQTEVLSLSIEQVQHGWWQKCKTVAAALPVCLICHPEGAPPVWFSLHTSGLAFSCVCQLG